jgi:predicted metal-binding membrane protein
VRSPSDRVLVSSCIAAIVVLAWAYLFRLAHQMAPGVEYSIAMAAMGMPTDAPWTLVDISLTFAMWVVMMVGMMAGAALPVLLLFARARAGRGEHAVRSTVFVFALGYLAVWVGFSACAALAQWWLHETAVLSPAMAAASPRIAGAILVVAGAYQLTPLKSACLAHCRSPLGFLLTNWRDGKFGAFQMGARHGVFCLGCCWALMCVLFAVGVMNLAWVLALSGLVLFEKVGPAGLAVSRVAGTVLIAAGLIEII